MRSISISRPSPSLILAIVALFVALGGTGYAAVKMSGTQIQKGTLPANRIVTDSIGGKQVDEARLATVPSAQSATSATNAASADAAQTAKQADKATLAANSEQLAGRGPGAFMASGTRVATVDGPVVPGAGGGTPQDVSVSCNPDERAIAGGGAWLIPTTQDPSALELWLGASMPTVAADGTVTGWRVTGRNVSGVDRFLRVYAVCVAKAA
jgi:hypothetical protein